jgi:hypothetical protein
MALQIYFETLASGMHAKLNSRYRLQSNHVRTISNNTSAKAAYPNSVRNGFLGDHIPKHRMFT